ncbi:MAG: hypothetical protein DRI69_07035 [Bacteroidetes bacterium]|nr:MAG: hypothetical protein DRI69_07035 [Bacteroidota bacterium]
MFEIQISDRVNSILEDYYREKLNAPICQSDRNVFENQVMGVRNSFRRIFFNLSVNPFSYPELGSGVYFAVSTYLPHVIFYTIENSCVKIFECLKREELF